jgi:uroporphyrinogen-III decarboxylase
MDVCELLWGSAIFTDIVDEPELVQAFLGLVTDTYAAFLREWNAVAPYRPPHSAHWGLLQKGELMLRDDSAMNFSPATYEEFILPHDRRLLAEFDGGAIHFCGRGSHYIGMAARIPGLTAIQLSQPEYNDMEEVFRHTVDRGVALLGLRRDAAEAARAAGRDLHGRVHCW